jgi:hypothetical protein
MIEVTDIPPAVTALAQPNSVRMGSKKTPKV